MSESPLSRSRRGTWETFANSARSGKARLHFLAIAMTLLGVSLRNDHKSFRIAAFSNVPSFLRALSLRRKRRLPIQIIGPQKTRRNRADLLNLSYSTEVETKPARRN